MRHGGGCCGDGDDDGDDLGNCGCPSVLHTMDRPQTGDDQHSLKNYDPSSFARMIPAFGYPVYRMIASEKFVAETEESDVAVVAADDDAVVAVDHKMAVLPAQSHDFLVQDGNWVVSDQDFAVFAAAVAVAAVALEPAAVWADHRRRDRDNTDSQRSW